MKKKWKHAFEEGKGFPPLPVDYGYRDGIHFWFSDASKPYAIDIPQHKEQNLDAIRFQVDRLDPEISWEDDALKRLVRIPRIFLKKALSGIVKQAKEHNVRTVTPEFLDKVQARRKRK